MTGIAIGADKNEEQGVSDEAKWKREGRMEISHQGSIPPQVNIRMVMANTPLE